jgi:hypothetical protein
MKRLPILLILLITSTAFAYPDNPAAYWPLDNNSGPNYPDIIGGHYADLGVFGYDVRDWTYYPGKINAAMKGGTGPAVPFTTHEGTNGLTGNALSISFWVKNLDTGAGFAFSNSNDDNCGDVSCADTGWLVYCGQNTIAFGDRNDGYGGWGDGNSPSVGFGLGFSMNGYYSSSTNENHFSAWYNLNGVDFNNTWNLITITYDNGATKIYVNAVDRTTNSQVGIVNPINSTAFIKFVIPTGAADAVDEIMIYKRVLTQGEINCLYDPNTYCPVTGGPGSDCNVVDCNSCHTNDYCYHEPNYDANLVSWNCLNPAYTNPECSHDYGFQGLNLVAGIGGHITTPGEGVFLWNYCTLYGPSDAAPGSICLLATPDPNYHFVNWEYVDSCGVSLGWLCWDFKNADCTVANTWTYLLGDYVYGGRGESIWLRANFAPTICTTILTVSTDTNGRVTTPGIGTFTYDCNADVNIIADANAHYRFRNWTGNFPVGKVNDVNSSHAVIHVDANYTILANFDSNQYSLTTSSDANGDVNIPGEGIYLYDHNSTAHIFALPNAHCHFRNWTGTATTAGKIANVNGPNTTVFMDSNYTAIANFDIDTFTLTYTAGAHGSITGTTPQVVNYGGSGTEVIAVPSGGYFFQRWSPDGCEVNPRTDTYITHDINVIAVFQPPPAVSLTASATTGGTVTAPGAGVYWYEPNTTITIIALASAGYTWSGWTGTGVTAGKVANANDINTTIYVDVNYTVIANFTPPVWTKDPHTAYCAFGVLQKHLPWWETDPNLKAWYKFDDNNDTNLVKDSSGNGNNGHATLATNIMRLEPNSMPIPPIRGTGAFGFGMHQPFSFNDDINIPANSAFLFGNNPKFSISMWVKAGNAPGIILSNARRYGFDPYQGWSFAHTIEMGGEYLSWAFGTAGNTEERGYGVVVGNWYHVVMVYNWPSMVLYVNSVAVNPATDFTELNNIDSTEDIHVGKQSGTIPFYFSGFLDDVMIFNRALSAHEVSDLYRGTDLP